MRRGILKRKIFVFMLSSLFIFTIGCQSKEVVNGKKLEIVKKEKWTQVGSDIFVFTGKYYSVNMTLVVSGKDAVLIDTGMHDEEYHNAVELIKEKGLKIKTIIITHEHNDHVANLEKFKTEDVALITPDNAQDNQIISVGDKNLKIMFTEGHYKPHAHISIEIENQSILIAGDIIDNDDVSSAVAPGGEAEELLETLQMFKGKNYSIIIPGHGEVGGSEMLNEHLEYFSKKINK